MSDLDNEELEATRRLNGVAKEEIEKAILRDAKKNLLDTYDTEAAKIIVEKCLLGNWVIVGGRINYIKLALRTLLAEREQKDKRIKELEEEKQIVGMPVRNKRDGKIGIVLHQWENGSIAVLENISPRVINTHDSFDTLEIITDEVKHVKTKDDSIPKQKLKDLEKKIINCKIARACNNGFYYDYLVSQKYKEVVIKLFKEVLEDK